MNGATVATDDHVILNPSIAQRYGIFMHTMPIETTDFEILFDLSVTDGPSGSRDSGFALWFTTMNYTAEFSKIRDELQKGDNKKDWRAAFNALDYSLLGQKSRFDGFGIVFTPKGASGDEYTVSVITNRNDQTISFDRDIPDRASSARVNLHANGAPVRIGIRVRPDLIMVRYRDGNRHWSDLTTKRGVSLPSSGYIGFTSWSGQTLPTEKVSIIDMHVYNMDMHKAGETLSQEVVDELSDGGKIDWQELLTKDIGEDTFQQTLALQKVTEILLNYIQTTQPELAKVHAQLDGWLKEMLTRESGDHKDRVEKVREQLTKVDGNDGRSLISDDLEDSISSSHSLANKLFMLCIIVVVVGGLYVWRQLQVVEKKHLF
ncbi:lectin-domain protein, putative [Perkinsus marinus ATCC 50983]|uniref:Lectin-domain protein, putative n=1 Tax=Perkinsus marinus (strain ATCC 50983 / TXsc) TaxID=423536 RepID=C5LG02_PERM5|nr:lectin-domain protein, putative [Perkinsus marinus ATCC 50983]EER04257.1 lectin-domain protein, putative [Perkinsus marinus ATCC 50983]|eukprot:XP_002772441.1 lectin-domain protein, putative [Perkinsus marinus ATCC 50983]